MRIGELCQVLDTLSLAREMHPGQRNNLDALCKRYGVDNSHRELHGALLDARILADVYLAMTGGQSALALEEAPRRFGARRALGDNAPPELVLRVVEPTAEERAAHEQLQELLNSESQGRCLWRAPMKILVTGAAGFIGSFTASRFLARGDEVVGLDNLNDYYDVNLKRARLARLEGHSGFRFVKLDLADQAGMQALFAREKFQRVVHLGAQAGVRHSMQDPHSYIASNVVGTLNVLEGCRHNGVGHLVYASTSSVYGASTRMPYSEHEPAAHPLSLYGASKRSTELMAHSYSSLFGVPTTGLRFFTVYGPWGRPDMALFLFARAILAGQPIEVFNNGHHKRDFTYVEDIAEGVVRATDQVATPNPEWAGGAPDPGDQPGPLPPLQYRQQPAR